MSHTAKKRLLRMFPYVEPDILKEKFVQGDIVYLRREMIEKNPGIVNVFGRKAVEVIDITYSTNTVSGNTVDIKIFISGSQKMKIMRPQSLEVMSQEAVDKMLYEMRSVILSDTYNV